jgi:hypothetical protein
MCISGNSGLVVEQPSLVVSAWSELLNPCSEVVSTPEAGMKRNRPQLRRLHNKSDMAPNMILASNINPLLFFNLLPG